MNDTPDSNPFADPELRRINGRLAMLQSRLDQCEEFLRMNRTAIEFLHKSGFDEAQRHLGPTLATSLVNVVSAWAFASIELADMRAGFEEAELLADELRHREASGEHIEGEQWKEGEQDKKT